MSPTFWEFRYPVISHRPGAAADVANMALCTCSHVVQASHPRRSARIIPRGPAATCLLDRSGGLSSMAAGAGLSVRDLSLTAQSRCPQFTACRPRSLSFRFVVRVGSGSFGWQHDL